MGQRLHRRSSGRAFVWVVVLLVVLAAGYFVSQKREVWGAHLLPNSRRLISSAFQSNSKTPAPGNEFGTHARYGRAGSYSSTADLTQTETSRSTEHRPALDSQEIEREKLQSPGLQRFGDLGADDSSAEHTPAPTPTYVEQKVFDNKDFGNILQQGMPRPAG